MVDAATLQQNALCVWRKLCVELGPIALHGKLPPHEAQVGGHHRAFV
jgi:hypothetical protein